jgi:hypothetical protein
MSQPLTIQVPEDLYIPLQALAQQSGKTPEEFTLQWLKETIQKFENDPLEAFIGSVESGISDWTEQSDQYLGEALIESEEHR